MQRNTLLGSSRSTRKAKKRAIKITRYADLKSYSLHLLIIIAQREFSTADSANYFTDFMNIPHLLATPIEDPVFVHYCMTTDVGPSSLLLRWTCAIQLKTDSLSPDIAKKLQW